jgi:hypothetical protein
MMCDFSGDRDRQGRYCNIIPIYVVIECMQLEQLEVDIMGQRAVDVIAREAKKQIDANHTQ